MKKLLIIALMTAVLSAPAVAGQDWAARKAAAQAEHQQKHDERFQAAKSQRLKDISVRLTAAQKREQCLSRLQSCVSAAADHKSMEACHGCPE